MAMLTVSDNEEIYLDFIGHFSASKLAPKWVLQPEHHFWQYPAAVPGVVDICLHQPTLPGHPAAPAEVYQIRQVAKWRYKCILYSGSKYQQ